MKVKIKKVHADAIIPEYKTEGAAGCDITAVEEVTIKPNESFLVRTGLSIESPQGYFVMLAPRSSFVLKKHLDVPNSVGIIDSDYRGEILMSLRNLGTEDAVIEKGERIGQILFIPVVQADFEVVEELTETQRGAGGFGSTGKF
mgnify:CR=1 FL=1